MSYCHRHDWQQERIDCPQCEANTLVASAYRTLIPVGVVVLALIIGLTLAALAVSHTS